MQIARIKLTGKDPKVLDQICKEVIEIAKKFGVDYRGPIPLPTKRIRVVQFYNKQRKEVFMDKKYKANFCCTFKSKETHFISKEFTAKHDEEALKKAEEIRFSLVGKKLILVLILVGILNISKKWKP